MANETTNRAHAGIVLRVWNPEDVDLFEPPTIVGSWGIIESTLVDVAGGDTGSDYAGLYTVRLEQPGSGIVAAPLSSITPITRYFVFLIFIDLPIGSESPNNFSFIL